MDINFRHRARRIATTLTAAVLSCVGSSGAIAAVLAEVTGFGTNPGNLRMFVYIPDNLQTASPLVVALHGCSQTASAYDDETGWIKFADEWGFALLLPEQQKSASFFRR